MLTELTEKRYAFDCGGSRIVLRYDMTAFLRLEERGYSYMDIFGERITGQALCDFLECGEVGELPVSAEDILHNAGGQALWDHLQNAVELAMPEHDPLVIDIPDEPGKPPDMARLRTLVCDVMRKPEDFFWHSTLRELLARWQDYAEVKGFAKKPERMELYDMEGME